LGRDQLTQLLSAQKVLEVRDVGEEGLPYPLISWVQGGVSLFLRLPPPVVAKAVLLHLEEVGPVGAQKPSPLHRGRVDELESKRRLGDGSLVERLEDRRQSRLLLGPRVAVSDSRPEKPNLGGLEPLEWLYLH
jgi:hypothetical protein